MHRLLFWMQSPLGPDISLDDWTDYLNDLGSEFFWIVIVSVAVICLFYTVWVRCLKFKDISRPFLPMNLLWLSIVPALIVGWRAISLFDSFESFNGKSGAISAAVESGIWAVIFVLLFAWIGFMMPGVVTPEYRNRPYRWLLALRHRRGETTA